MSTLEHEVKQPSGRIEQPGYRYLFIKVNRNDYERVVRAWILFCRLFLWVIHHPSFSSYSLRVESLKVKLSVDTEAEPQVVFLLHPASGMPFGFKMVIVRWTGEIPVCRAAFSWNHENGREAFELVRQQSSYSRYMHSFRVRSRWFSSPCHKDSSSVSLHSVLETVWFYKVGQMEWVDISQF